MAVTIDEYAANFLKQHIWDIDNNNFDKVYEDWEKKPDYLTRVLMSSDVNPLPYLSNIPQGFAESLYNIEEVILTPITKAIESTAFLECSNLNYLYLPKSIKRIGMHAFLKCPKLEVEYEGTINDFKNIELYYTSFDETSVIKCSDGKIRFVDIYDR